MGLQQRPTWQMADEALPQEWSRGQEPSTLTNHHVFDLANARALTFEFRRTEQW
jgi:hypothetical protein